MSFRQTHISHLSFLGGWCARTKDSRRPPWIPSVPGECLSSALSSIWLDLSAAPEWAAVATCLVQEAALPGCLGSPASSKHLLLTLPNPPTFPASQLSIWSAFLPPLLDCWDRQIRG